MNEYIYTGWFWFGAAVFLIILEVMLGASFFLLSLGMSAALVGGIVFVLPKLAGVYQVLLFALIALCSLVWLRYYLKTNTHQTKHPHLNRRAEQYMGRVFALSEAIENGRGKIRVDDSTWLVEGMDAPSNTLVKVVGVDGVILKVKRMDVPDLSF